MNLRGSFSDGFAHDLVNSCLKFDLEELGKIKLCFLSINVLRQQLDPPEAVVVRFLSQGPK